MKRLDHAGLNYLIDVATDTGFTVRGVETREREDSQPRVWMELVQERDLQDKPEAKTEPATEEPAKKASNLRMLDGTEI